MFSAIDIFTMGQRFNKAYTKIIRQVAEEHQMTKLEIDILLFLNNNPSFDTAKDIVALRALSKSNVSKAVEALHKRGYLQIAEDKKDRRTQHLYIETAASHIVNQAATAQQHFFELLYKGISDEERRILKSVQDKMIQNLNTIG